MRAHSSVVNSARTHLDKLAIFTIALVFSLGLMTGYSYAYALDEAGTEGSSGIVNTDGPDQGSSDSEEDTNDDSQSGTGDSTSGSDQTSDGEENGEQNGDDQSSSNNDQDSTSEGDGETSNDSNDSSLGSDDSSGNTGSNDSSEDSDATQAVEPKPLPQPSKAGWAQASDGTWYYFANPTSAPKTGWFKSGGKWYYLDPAENGAMKTGLYQVAGKNYISNSSGVMQAKKWVKLGTDWYYATSSGALKSGWFKSGGKWYWLSPSEQGKMTSNAWIDDKNKQYYLSNSGAMKTGWVKDGNSWYYTSSSGAKKLNGWVKSGSKWYWLSSDNNGAMAENAWVADKGKQYYLGASGAMAKGWIKDGPNWYYADKTGAKKLSGWIKSGGKWYWLRGDQNGVMATDTLLAIDGKQYLFAVDGAMLTRGSAELADNKYGFATKSGEVIPIGVYDENKDVILGSNVNSPLTGWQKLAGYWFYGNPETGLMQTGWLELDGKKYYLEDSGAMATGARNIDGESFYFNHNGVMTNRPYANASASSKLVAAANALPYQGNGYCAKWVNYVYVRAGYAHPDGHAYTLYNKYCTISDLDLMEPGMIIAVPSHSRTAIGSKYGHVAIYMGNGMVRHNTNKLETVSLSSWLDYYQTTHQAKCGWAFPKK